jgi:hypothetical protein
MAVQRKRVDVMVVKMVDFMVNEAGVEVETGSL